MRVRKLAVAMSLAALTLAGCGSSSGTTDAAAPEPTPSAGGFSVRDPWVKAADEGMTAAFGTLVNNGPAEVTITGAASDVSPMELHEMAMDDAGAMVMRQKEGGLVVPAGGTHVLEPGGDHLMMMELSKPVKPGDVLAFTLTFADGTTTEFTAVAKPFTGAQESYAPEMGDGMSGMPVAPR